MTTDKTMKTVKAGAKIGAAVGTVIFLVGGIAPGLYFGSHGAVILLSTLTGGAVEPGLFVRFLVGAGAAIGILCAGAFSVVSGLLAGAALAYIAETITSLVSDTKAARDARARHIVIRTHKKISQARESEIRSRLSFLDAWADTIHSVAIVGSAAYETGEHGSDIDIVVVCTERGYEEVRNAVCDREIDEALDRTSGQKIEYIVLDPSATEELFRLHSPFAYAMRHGSVLWDDGYLRTLLNTGDPRMPGRTHFMRALYDTILVQYYGSMQTAEKNAKEFGCSDACCRQRQGCQGLPSPNMLATVIMRMLYITLPSRGYMPLTKADVIAFAKQVYGEDSAETVQEVAGLLRSGSPVIYYTDQRRLKRFAPSLFREVLSIIGFKQDLITILRDAARLMRGEHGTMQDRHFRQCIQ